MKRKEYTWDNSLRFKKGELNFVTTLLVIISLIKVIYSTLISLPVSTKNSLQYVNHFFSSELYLSLQQSSLQALIKSARALKQSIRVHPDSQFQVPKSRIPYPDYPFPKTGPQSNGP